MPIITFTPADVMSTTLAEAGWYRATVTQIDGPKASASGNSFTYFTTFTLHGKYEGKALTVAYNSATKGRSILGATQYSPVAELIQVRSAVLNIPADPSGFTLDTDELLNKELDIQVSLETIEGVIVNGITGYQGAGKSADSKLPF